MNSKKELKEVNSDLAKERQKCNFNIEEVTNIIDGGKEKTFQRRKIENIALNGGASKDIIPEECLGPVEKYENAVRKSCLYSKIVKEEVLSFTGLETFGSPVIRRTSDAFFKDISPFLLHLGMFVPSIMGQCTSEQQAYWLPKALDLQIIGTYAQTELGHGTFIRGLETTATYDPETEEFILHSPTMTSYKWWAGGLGHTVNHCIVVAKLLTKGKCYGTHPFIVQIRDLETHMPLPGIKVGDIGPRMGFNTADNGFLGFENFRIPRENMMMKYAQVLKDGTYVKVGKHEKLTYGTMVFVRVTLVNEAAFNLAKAVTIAVRYSAVRRQSQPKPDEPEPQILDYVTQQHKLFICIATAHALQLTGSWLWRTFTKVLADMRSGNTDNLPELHALSSCLKAVSTSDAAMLIEQCRHACGGHGYMLSSNLPFIYSFVTATRTYEGDYTVLLLQTARFLVKAWEQAEAGKPVTPTVSYLARAFDGNKVFWENTPDGIIRCFEGVAAGKTSACVRSIRKRVESGMLYEDAWQLTTVQLVSAAEAHCRAVLIRTYWKETARLTATASSAVKAVMLQLASLYLIYWNLEKTGDLLRYSTLSEEDIVNLQHKYEELLAQIRPNAVGLVDAFDLRDEPEHKVQSSLLGGNFDTKFLSSVDVDIFVNSERCQRGLVGKKWPEVVLNSTLGAYDGRVYERLMEEALKSPLNKQPVNDSFHKYLKPFMRGKL